MDRLRKFGNPIIILIILSLLIQGCISQQRIVNASPAQSDVYTAPIGGFEKTQAIIDPNETFETDYIFYSRNWGPGEVHYVIRGESGSYHPEPFVIDPAQIRIVPSDFTAEPNHTYRSRLFLNTSSLPADFKIGAFGCSNRGEQMLRSDAKNCRNVG